jgi:catalase
VRNVAGAAGGVRSEDIRERIYQYWKDIDKNIGDRIEAAIKAKRAEDEADRGGARFD